MRQLGITRSAILTAPAAGTPFIGSTELLANYSGEPIHAEVRLSMEIDPLAGVAVAPPQQADCIPGTSAQEPRCGGYFLLQYGIGAFTSVRYVNLRSALLNLGYCDNVRISARRWQLQTAWPSYSSNTYRVSACVGLAQGGAYDEMESSAELFSAAGAAMSTGSLFAPQGAYGCSIQIAGFSAGVTVGQTWLGGGEIPINVLMRNETIRYEWDTGLLVPSFRRYPEAQAVRFTSGGVALVTPMCTRVNWYLSP